MKFFTLALLLLFSFSVFAQQTETMYLSGTGADDTVDWEFFCSKGQNSGKWTNIAVPSCWEQKGFGGYNYGHDKFETRLNETGHYKYSFSVPVGWKQKEVSIVFEGVMTDAEVKINGKLAGAIHQGAFYRFQYNITKLLKVGKENQLEVLVKKHSGNKSINLAERKADFWIFGGIYRPVFLEAKPRTNIQRVAIDAKADGSFKADVYLTNYKAEAKRIRVDILDLDGKKQGSFIQDVSSTVSRLENKFEKLKTWNPEEPNLYNAVFSLLNKRGQTIHQYTERIGFRTVDVRTEEGIFVNGVKIKMKGVNRHTFHPKHARTSSKELSITAVNLMKDMNMNAVRMSHYSPDKHFLDVCDSLGMFVLDELTAWQKPSYDDVIGRKLLEELIADDVNHPSIIIWDNGNEGGENNNLNDDFAELDIQKRIVIHPWQDYEMTNTIHYIDYDYLSYDGFSKRKIFFPTEFMHGLFDGGHGVGLEDYWFRMWHNPLCAGGFLWVFADEAIERTDKNNELDTDGNHAPDGILGPYNEKEGSFYTIKDIWSPIQFEKKYITPQFDGNFTIENRYHFTNLDQCKISGEWIEASNPNEELKEKNSDHFQFVSDLKPGEKGKLFFPLLENWQTYDALRIKAWDPTGRLINTWTWPIKKASVKSNELLKEASDIKPTFQETNSQFNVQAGKLKVSFSKEDGTISNIERDGKRIPLANGPVFVSKEKMMKVVEHDYIENELQLRFTFENIDQFVWTISKEGMIDLDVAYQPANQCQFAGITFDFPEDQVKSMKWLGNGPFRVYKNRMRGPKFGIWEKEINHTITGESGYEYPEFKGYHSEVYWAAIKTTNNTDFKVYIHSDDIFLRMLTPENPQNARDTKMEYPKGNISFLHGINSIGSKFRKAERFGPQSKPYFFHPGRIYGGKLTMKLTFDFN